STSKSGGGKYAAIYTRCMSGADVSTEKCRRGKMIKADLLTDLTYDAFIRALGPAPMTETVIIPGQDHTAEIADLEAHLARLQEDRLDGLYDGPGRELYVTTFKRLTARLAALQEAPTTTDTVVTRATGQTYAAHWARPAVVRDHHHAPHGPPARPTRGTLDHRHGGAPCDRSDLRRALGRAQHHRGTQRPAQGRRGARHHYARPCCRVQPRRRTPAER